MVANQQAHVTSLVLDATPLITQSYTHYQYYAKSFYTTPTVFHEIKDEQARKNLEIWQSLGTLKLRHPSTTSIKRVSDFAKLTGDFSVLSANDIHIIALTYELEAELNGGDWRLRKKPGDTLDESRKIEKQEVVAQRSKDDSKKKKRRRGGKKQREKRMAAAASMETETVQKEGKSLEDEGNGEVNASKEETVIGETQPSVSTDASQVVLDHSEAGDTEEVPIQPEATAEERENGVYFEDDDDGDWITPENLTEAMIKDSGEDTSGSGVGEDIIESTSQILKLPQNQVALATGDFAVQNVALQMNLNLMNFMSGLRIKKLRNYMLRCHACFRLLPIPKDGVSKHFCPSCGGYSTLMRCAVSVDATTGEVTPHLKANFQWNNRGNRYSLASPLSKNSQKKFGKKGFVHTKHPQDVVILREDQKEYEKAVKQEDWTRRHNEKVLNNWIGGGSADNYISPFAISGLKHHSVRVGRGRHINSSKKRK
ncbi:LAFE_0F02036g1_1 [Lachancea fermentati]|uniref:20S-pre-rRNA D-site endonuclease NOB1 n=1 Tax=Lachancea fermentati TaxID=4955 RepID=A0A1G4MER5_LACFM|nr:LAFE_0F02036g1_1 [Lachancea fermentati]